MTKRGRVGSGRSIHSSSWSTFADSGVRELRALFGGVFIGLATTCLVLDAPGAYWAAASAFLGGGSAKLLAGLLERGVFPQALPGVAVDLIAGGLFVWGARSLGAAG